MGDIKRNLSRWEVKCLCGKCDSDTVDSALADALQDAVEAFEVRYHTKIRLKVLSGHRCAQHNKSEGGASKSLHLSGRAADHVFFIVATGNMIDPDEVASYYEQRYPNKYGIGRYGNRFTHLDTRSGLKARWDNRNDI